ncbi:MAG: SGNH/GDSL hydrolase family protein [Verrucomicrobiae bacterium]|nr:SGNH/GDSL hydrolase family protein [Verrucomicrobiae bacterium]
MKRRLHLLIVLAVLGVCATGTWYYFSQSRPVGGGCAGPAVPAEAFVQPWTDRTVLLVGLGDSVTAGFGARKGYGYFDRLVANPPDEFPDLREINLRAVLPGLRATNLAVSGSTSLDLVKQQLTRLPVADSNVLGLVVITTGGNDLIHDYGRTPAREVAMFGADWQQASPWVQNFATRLEVILDQVNARFPGGCQIFLANIYDPTDGVGDIQRAGLPAWPDGLKILAAYNGILERGAERRANVHLIDLHAAFLGHGLHCTQFWRKHYDARDPNYWYHTNVEDPNERGYDAIRRLFLLEMTKIRSRLVARTEG